MSLTVSAPGKVILFGDHSVVYDRRAVAASISLRTTLTFTSNMDEQITLDFPDIGLHLVLDRTELDAITRSSKSSGRATSLPLPSLDLELLDAIEITLSERGLEGVTKAAAAAFLYLFFKLQPTPDKAVFGTYHIMSALPIGAGLGSSASVSVIIAATLLQLIGAIELPSTSKNAQADEKHLDLINKWAYVGEQCIHGNPSGVDNTVATYGGAVAFQKSLPIELIHAPALPLLLTNTGVPRSTKAQVAGVADLRASFPPVIENILDAMHQIAIEAQGLLPDARENKDRIGALMELNQGLLRTLGVSHPAIEEVVRDNHTKGWTKLIGAGGGGCVITLLKDEAVSLVSPDSSSSKPEQYLVALGGSGVGFHTETGVQHYTSMNTDS
ncbi:Mevalonate kinase [Taphrina deformans PYCC 5710]|uniref:Mevalonate kinase n=1 Tax=Taphrina deformans (strain PYCC 5710 / ATCC 11124 / CBS 356.35 / IMI 108563 / JCM 9778 / NBRC 8474) TaxID=1097556 RepID=R4X710_TAPDE|nr:Mevalonate kinase [Taphrina deformans PYCC 5710]|eukprot:CCG80818.1 Mevalonate kinase [Taphrina deformans PYCC 5710]